MDNYPGYIPDEPPSPCQDCSVQCTPEQLRDAGYVRPPPVPSNYLRDAEGILIDPHPLTTNRTARPLDHTANIRICCLEPPPVPSAAVSSIQTHTHFFSILIASTIIINIVNCSH
jgi:hypothetical protein